MTYFAIFTLKYFIALQGASGPPGPAGRPGLQGARGIQGDRGADGSSGPQVSYTQGLI